MGNIKHILKEQLKLIKPSDEELKIIGDKTKNFSRELKAKIKKAKLKADVFVGGSVAKETLIKKDKYDADIFVRFDKKYNEDKISDLLKKIIPKNAVRIHGSRDYFSLKTDRIEFEIIPVLNIRKPQEAENITDLSYFHVKYINDKIKKNPRLAEEIILSKAFAYFRDCYGAESYINGFSGYALELLIIHYKTFLNFLKAVVKAKDKIIIDMQKSYKNKEAIMMEMNEAKLQSPIILVDPTFKERNALAALSNATFERFKEESRRFLKNPSERFFEKSDVSEKLKKKYGNKLIKLVLQTERQAGDIAGTKLKKFYRYFISETEKLFAVKEKFFEYDDAENQGKIFLAAEPKKEILFSGPPIEMADRLAAFKKQHRNVKIKAGKSYAMEKLNINFEKFLDDFLNERGKVIGEMGVTGVDIVE